MGHDELCKAFYNGLYDKENMTKEEFIEYKFKFCGIYEPPYKRNDEGHKVYIKEDLPKEGEKLFPTKNFLKHPRSYLDETTFKKLVHRFIYKRKCICETGFMLNCFIYSESGDILLNIGGCCNERFNENGTKRFCENCNVHHKNKKNNFCNECRKHMYDKCKKCKKDKKFNNYELCSSCNNITYIKKTYYYCSKCYEQKLTEKEQEYELCTQCFYKDKKYKCCKKCGIKKTTKSQQKYPLCFDCNNL